MGLLMIKCPNTGRGILTGMNATESSFNSSPVFFGRTFCPDCEISHEWFAKDAWVSDHGSAAAVHGTAMTAEIGFSLPAAWEIKAQAGIKRSRGR
jgi:hypothetical protein